MKTTIKLSHFLYLIATILVMGGCSKDNSEGDGKDSFISAYDGTPFRGTSKGMVVIGNSSRTWNGKSSIALTDIKADSASMVFRADFGDDATINFMLRGREQGMSLISDASATSNFRIADRNISGKVNNPSQEIVLEGTSSANKIFMTMKVTFKEETDGFPKGTVLTVSFDAERESGDGNGGEGCQLRMVPIWGPNGMTMGMVPDCD